MGIHLDNCGFLGDIPGLHCEQCKTVSAKLSCIRDGAAAEGGLGDSQKTESTKRSLCSRRSQEEAATCDPSFSQRRFSGSSIHRESCSKVNSLPSPLVVNSLLLFDFLRGFLLLVVSFFFFNFPFTK